MLQESMRTSQKWRLGTLLLLGPLIALLLSSCPPRSPLDETPIPIGTTEPSMEVPAPVTPPAVPLACGSETYFAIRKDGTLIGWGNNENGTLGGSDLHIPVTEPREIMTDIRAVSSGQWVTLMIDKENTLWGIGMDYFGHLGPDEDKQQQHGNAGDNLRVDDGQVGDVHHQAFRPFFHAVERRRQFVVLGHGQEWCPWRI